MGHITGHGQQAGHADDGGATMAPGRAESRRSCARVGGSLAGRADTGDVRRGAVGGAELCGKQQREELSERTSEESEQGGVSSHRQQKKKTKEEERR